MSTETILKIGFTLFDRLDIKKANLVRSFPDRKLTLYEVIDKEGYFFLMFDDGEVVEVSYGIAQDLKSGIFPDKIQEFLKLKDLDFKKLN